MHHAEPTGPSGKPFDQEPRDSSRIFRGHDRTHDRNAMGTRLKAQWRVLRFYAAKGDDRKGARRHGPAQTLQSWPGPIAGLAQACEYGTESHVVGAA